MLLKFLNESHVDVPYCLNFDSYFLDPRPNSRKSIRETEKLEKKNEYYVKHGFLPEHFSMNSKIKL